MKKKLLHLSIAILLQAGTLKVNAQTSWLITGNSNTSTTSFIGTKNGQPLIFRTSNIERMRISKNGRIGIGTSVFSLASVTIANPINDNGLRVINSFGSAADHVGVYSSSVIRDGWGYGIEALGGFRGSYSECDGGAYTGSGIGAYGAALGSAGSRYGVYGFASGGTFNAAGYFDGDVWAVSYNLISDRKVKTNITPLKNSLEQLMKLKPSSYQFKTADYPKWGLSTGKQIGLVADEVKQVFPELVKEGVHPAEYGKDKTVLLRPEEKYEGINYIGLIPVLIGSIQEQQKTIDDIKAENKEIKAENEDLKSRLNKIEQALSLSSGQIVAYPVTLTDARLEQNAPNPFNKNTVISYFLPEKAGSAVMNITDMNGKIIKTIALNEKGKGQLLLEAGQLTAGTYQYSLLVNGKVLDTKKMVLTK